MTRDPSQAVLFARQKFDALAVIVKKQLLELYFNVFGKIIEENFCVLESWKLFGNIVVVSRHGRKLHCRTTIGIFRLALISLGKILDQAGLLDCERGNSWLHYHFFIFFFQIFYAPFFSYEVNLFHLFLRHHFLLPELP
jgi:hypothetical protein